MGRKRHIMTDTQGLLLSVQVHAANIMDRDGAVNLFEKSHKDYPSLRKIWCDGGYNSHALKAIATNYEWDLEVVKRPRSRIWWPKEKPIPEDVIQPLFSIVPRRWVVERTFAWFGRSRRLRSDYEQEAAVSENMIYICMIRLMLNRLSGHKITF